jgi:hypothetical protein
MEPIRYAYRVRRKDINYIRSTIESYDGMGIVSTLDPHEAVIEVLVTSGCLDVFEGLVGSLTENESVPMRRVTPPAGS